MFQMFFYYSPWLIIALPLPIEIQDYLKRSEKQVIKLLLFMTDHRGGFCILLATRSNHGLAENMAMHLFHIMPQK